jgi:hypothetical protein
LLPDRKEPDAAEWAMKKKKKKGRREREGDVAIGKTGDKGCY